MSRTSCRQCATPFYRSKGNTFYCSPWCRLLAKTVRAGDCLLWNASFYRLGYGTVYHDGRNERAHRVAYDLTFGPIPSGRDVEQSCGARACINPTHLVLVERHPRPTMRQRIASSTRVNEDGCWLWTGHTSKDGYAQLRRNGRKCRAHRVSYEEFVGPIPAGLEIDHLCMRPSCVNPEHLEPVTHDENMRRRYAEADS